jgi:hypothetical protein
MAPFYPILRHFKVCTIDLSAFETDRPAALYCGHWQDQPAEFRTGLPFRVSKVDDLFVTGVRKYACCSRFDGTFNQAWNMGEEYRPDGIRLEEFTAVPDGHMAPMIPQGGKTDRAP